MNNEQFFIYLMIVALSTYLIRAVPFSLIRKKITNVYVNSFLYYIPYTVLAAMTFPAAIYVTGSIYSAIAGLIVALIFAIKEKSLTFVAITACLTSLLIELIMMIL
ncbi:MAG: AzlD domain-containing protein [Bacilli bacterium]|nr:AzlD domain-containing protein [Bacilli bacterium]